jgi:hypothetical protein
MSTNTNPEPPTLLRERWDFNVARREETRDRDAPRFRLAEERAPNAHLTIPYEKGFAVYPPDHVEKAAAVVAAGNELIDSIGHDALAEKAQKGFMANGFIPEAALGLDSPYLQIALGDEVVDAASAYLGFVPVLWKVDVWYSFYRKKMPRSSQLWHLDHADTTQLKVFIHLDDVSSESGPLTVVDAEDSEKLADGVGWVFDDGRRVTDDQVIDVVGADGILRFEGPAGTVDFVDTSRCFHFGSRVEPNGTPRRLFMAQYLTPYAFKFRDHRDAAPYRHLASDASSELEALVLGAV